MAKQLRIGVFVALLLCLGLCQAQVKMPKPGSAERKAILDAVRRPYEKHVGEKTVFYNVVVRVVGNWAFASGDGRNVRGGYLKFWPEGVDPDMVATLRKQRGRWRIIYWGASSDESAFAEAIKYSRGAPKKIFPPDRFEKVFPTPVSEHLDDG